MKLAVIADGGFLLSMIRQRVRAGHDTEKSALGVHKWLTKDLVQTLSAALNQSFQLFRVYYYDCYPYEGEIRHPLTGHTRESAAPNRKKFLDTLARLQYVWLRPGYLSLNGWKIKDLPQKIQDCSAISQYDLEPNFDQKEVDIRIAVDVCEMVNSGAVDAVLFITADRDFTPLMESARGKGVQVYLCNLGKPVPHAMLAACDYHLDIAYQTNNS